MHERTTLLLRSSPTLNSSLRGLGLQTHKSTTHSAISRLSTRPNSSLRGLGVQTRHTHDANYRPSPNPISPLRRLGVQTHNSTHDDAISRPSPNPDRVKRVRHKRPADPSHRAGD